VARLVVVREDERRPPIRPEHRLAVLDERSPGTRGPWRADQLPVEDEVAGPGEGGRPLRAAIEQLADREAVRKRVHQRPEARKELDEIRLVAIVDVDLAGPCRRARLDRVREQVRMLQEHVEHVEPKAVDAAFEPAPNHAHLGHLDLRVSPVQVRLLRQERVLVELAPPRLPGPGRATEERDPVVRRQRFAIRVDAGRIAPQIPVGVGVVARPPAGIEPGVLIAGVVHDEVEDQPHAPAMDLVEEAIEIGFGAEDRVDPSVVADVVADVEPG
jgi:hypothetical protein